MAAKNQFVFGKVSAGHLTKEVLGHRLITNLYVWLYQWMVITNELNVSMSLREILFCRVRIHRPFSRSRHLTTTSRIHFSLLSYLNLSIPLIRFKKKMALICTRKRQLKHSGSCSKMTSLCNCLIAAFTENKLGYKTDMKILEMFLIRQSRRSRSISRFKGQIRREKRERG